MAEQLRDQKSTKRKILLIDGEGQVWAALSEPLSTHGYEVRRGRSFGEALLLLSELRFDLVMSVQMVNRRSIHAVLNLLRDVYSGPLLVLTAGPSARDTVTTTAVRNDGIADLAATLSDQQVILARVETMMTRSPTIGAIETLALALVTPADKVEEPEEVWFGSALSRTITTPRSERVYLTKPAYDLLVYLVSRRGELVTRDELIRAYRGTAPTEQRSNIATVMIAKLRARLSGLMGGRPVIQTVYGLGYMFTGFDLVEDGTRISRPDLPFAGSAEATDGPGRSAHVETSPASKPASSAEAWLASARSRTILAPNGDRLHLSKASYALFVYLVRRRGELVTRSELVEAYTGIAPGEQKSHVPHILIAKLRVLLSPYMGGKPVIQAVYGRGYRFTGFDLVEDGILIAGSEQTIKADAETIGGSGVDAPQNR